MLWVVWQIMSHNQSPGLLHLSRTITQPCLAQCLDRPKAALSVLAPCRCAWGSRQKVGLVLPVKVSGSQVSPCTASCTGMAQAPPKQEVVVRTPGDVGLITELLRATEVLRVVGAGVGPCRGHPAKVASREGSDVKAGNCRFAIDAAPYAAALQCRGQCWRGPRPT